MINIKLYFIPEIQGQIYSWFKKYLNLYINYILTNQENIFSINEKFKIKSLEYKI
jgi:hypothetical protein